MKWYCGRCNCLYILPGLCPIHKINLVPVGAVAMREPLYLQVARTIASDPATLRMALYLAHTLIRKII